MLLYKMWYKILRTFIFTQNTKNPKKFQSCPMTLLKYFIFLNSWANYIFCSWQAVWPTSSSFISQNTCPRQNVHSDAMAVSENALLGGGILWNDLWKMSPSITRYLPRLKDISPSLSELLCVEVFMLLFSIIIYIFKNCWQILEERIQFKQPWTLKQFTFSNYSYTCNWKRSSTTDFHCIWYSDIQGASLMF